MSIRFGTSGWHAVIADEFTCAHVRLVTNAICGHFRSNLSEDDVIIVGHDTRFLGEQFANDCARLLRSNGFRALLCDGPTPTPTISHAIRSQNAAGGINFTASHNPAEYSGMKLSTADGAPALPEITRHVERLIAESQSQPSKTGDNNQTSPHETHEPRSAYLSDLAKKINFQVIVRAAGRYAYDPIRGTGRGYLDQLLRSTVSRCTRFVIGVMFYLEEERPNRKPRKFTRSQQQR
jgi:phosphoglucomutase